MPPIRYHDWIMQRDDNDTSTPPDSVPLEYARPIDASVSEKLIRRSLIFGSWALACQIIGWLGLMDVIPSEAVNAITFFAVECVSPFLAIAGIVYGIKGVQAAPKAGSGALGLGLSALALLSFVVVVLVTIDIIRNTYW